MPKGISRRDLILAASLGGVTWSGLAAAAPASFTVQLGGAQSVPPVPGSGSGIADLTWDPATREVTWSITFTGLSSPATMAHFHNAPAGKNGPVAVWLSTKGTAPQSPITGKATLTPDQATQFAAGDMYINLHTQSHPAGEIRGQVTPPKS